MQDGDNYDVVAMSNWKEALMCIKAGMPTPEIILYWGYTDKETGEKVILAIVKPNKGRPEEYWVSPALMTCRSS